MNDNEIYDDPRKVALEEEERNKYFEKRAKDIVCLLNQYEEHKNNLSYMARNYIRSYYSGGILCATRVDDTELGNDECTAVIISKGYNFIRWLFNKGKLDIDEINRYLEIKFPYSVKSRNKKEYKEQIIDAVLILLSIYYEPLELLYKFVK